ncbi:MAG TPA: type II and III secretion system protein family protein [Candidatus Nanoarchaeia archaeon]|nr:type II and III secretion system protein family protein [Candidatus Nanoarchaeia archaeon]
MLIKAVSRFGFAVLILAGSIANSQQQGDTSVAPAVQPGAAAESQTLHVIAGRSVIVNSQARLKRILVSNPTVVETTTATPTQLVVSAKAPGAASIVVWDETGRARILDVSSNVDVSALRDALQQAYPNENIQVEADQARIVLSGSVKSKAVAEEAAKLAGSYSKEVVNTITLPPVPRTKQLMLKVRFAEVNRTKLTAWGFNVLSTGAANTPGVITTQQFGPPSLSATGKITGTIPGRLPGFTTELAVNDLLNIFLFRPDLNLGATIRALEAKNVLQILAEPNLMARSGEPAKFIAGGEFPFPVVQGGTGLNAVTIQFRPFGVRLDFLAVVQDDNTIRLKVAPEVSALDFANALSFEGFVVPAISTRRAETDVELKDGQSFGIAGLIDKRTTLQMSKVPGIGDIPILGQLFRSKSTNRTDTELMVIVTPVIVDPLTTPGPAPELPKRATENLDREQFDKSIAPRKEDQGGTQKKDQ